MGGIALLLLLALSLSLSDDEHHCDVHYHHSDNCAHDHHRIFIFKTYYNSAKRRHSAGEREVKNKFYSAVTKFERVTVITFARYFHLSPSYQYPAARSPVSADPSVVWPRQPERPLEILAWNRQ
jgi:hypothetical protein